MYGRDYHYANTRLADTVVRLEKCGTPIYLHTVHGNGEVVYETLDVKNAPHQVCHLDDVNTCPVPLGYVNHQGGCSFIERMPVRRYRQGLRRDNMVSRDGTNVSRLAWEHIAKTIKGEYPSLEKCVKDSINNGAVYAWSRNWAIDWQSNIYYKGTLVGTKTSKTSFELKPRYQYLKEALEESL
jgi:hypothetical protein